jgi:hypothetical protein
MIRLVLLASVVEGFGGLSPMAQVMIALGLLVLLAGIFFGPSDRPLQRLLALIEALKRPRRERRLSSGK